ncbi:MAG: inorganic pyrophosphatase Ppa, partial [Desulfobulbaceae bacterium]|nr:inorganic pyrophosphatase Ppa [Desulfobulbaceae bacterium]
PEKIILVPDPFSSSTFYYEFRGDDISHAEEVSNIVNIDGETVVMARIWVKKMTIAMRCTPFLVEDMSR